MYRCKMYLNWIYLFLYHDYYCREAGCTDLSVFNMNVDTDCDIDFTLPILHMKCSAIQLLWEESQQKEVFNIYVDSLQQLATVAREAARHQVAVV